MGLTVAHVVATSGRSGVESHLRALFEGLRAEGIRSILVCPAPGPLTEALEGAGFEVRLAAPVRRAGWGGLARLRGAVDDSDVVHSHGPRPLWWSALMRWTGRRRALVGTVHEFGRRGVGSWRGPWFARIERASLLAQDALIAVSREQRRRLLESGAAPARALHVVLGSSPILLEAPRTQFGAESPPFAITVARLERDKGIDVLLEAWALLASRGVRLNLEIWGEGSQRPGLEIQAARLGISSSARFCGLSREPYRRTERAILYVAPSRTETFGISVLEAMALGVPVVATSVGGHLDLLGAVDDALLVPPEDPAALASAVEVLLRRPEEDRPSLGRRLALRAAEEFSPRRMARETRAVYETAIGASPAPASISLSAGAATR
jgi:glycosyltransferase involved in cell wall biosynthesis